MYIDSLLVFITAPNVVPPLAGNEEGEETQNSSKQEG